jgi:hypothetical protein
MKPLALFAVLVFASSSALAGRCPADMKKIDAAFSQSPKASAAQLAEAKKLRAEGEALHKAGKHADSEATLAKAMKILGI